MKICAIRLSEVGCFSGAVALEGLSGGLNVLMGPNEAGKSTILKALRFAFEEKHTSRKAEVLRPYAGGAPLVEVEFECGGQSYRLRKQYLTGRTAELKELGSGRVSRGGDAEERLAQLLASECGRGPMGLLWAGQREALSPEPLEADAVQALNAAIASEIEAAANGSEARRLRGHVRRELEVYVTGHKPPRPRGDYDTALKARDRLMADVRLATDRRSAALARLDQLAGLKVREEELSDPTRAADRAAALEGTQAVLAEAREALQKLRIAADGASAAESRFALAKSVRDALASDLSRLEVLTGQLASAEREAVALNDRLIREEAGWKVARSARDAARSTLAALAAELKAADDATRRNAARKRLIELEEVLRQAEAATQLGLALRERLAASKISDEAVRAIRGDAEAAQRLQDQLNASAPRLTIAYEDGAAGRIRDRERAVREGETVLVERPLVLSIEGIGKITIEPGDLGDREGLVARLAELRGRLARRFADAGAGSLAQAEGALEARRDLEGQLAEARTRYAALAPAGTAKLQSEVDELRPLAQGEAIDEARERGAIEADDRRARDVCTQAEANDEASQSALAQLREAVARHASVAASLGQQKLDLEQRLHPAGPRQAELQRLDEDVRTCEAALNAAVREHAAWRERAPDAAALRVLEEAAGQAELAKRQDERSREDVRRVIAGLEGELRADRADEVEAKVAELEGALAAAEQRLARIEDDVACLQLLDAEIGAQEQQSRNRYLGPVTERLAPYVGLVFPGADCIVGEDFAPVQLRRSANGEEIAALSDGTQEQLAVLVRLAFARLLVETGRGVPLILDDALVYSDDERIERMFGALAEASRLHQVIVLTCRSRAFEGLGGHRLRIAPWRYDVMQDDQPRLAAGGGR